MSLPDVVSREEWLAARRRLLAREKELTRQRDALSADRRRLPMARVDQEYAFEGSDGPAGLRDMFDGSRQLIIYHAMFDPAGDSACPGCTALLDETSPGLRAHLKARDTAFAVVSRAPQARLAAYAAARGWTFPWYSSYGSDFNYDFQATLDSGRQPIVYNYREEPDMLGDNASTEVPGLSCFLRDGGQVFHTYSTWARGSDTIGSSYSLLDITALGRQEDWEEPKGRAPRVHGADPTFTD